MRLLPKRSQIRTESPIEQTLLDKFHEFGLFPSIQFPIGDYRADFAFPNVMLAVECDGKNWHTEISHIFHDKAKDKFLQDNGWKIMRVSGSDIYKNTDEIVANISEYLDGKKDISRRWLTAKQPPNKIYIDYENDSLDVIEEKEQQRQWAENDFEEDGESVAGFSPLKQLIKDPLKYYNDKMEAFKKQTA